MIADATALQEIRNSWDGIRQLRETANAGIAGSLGTGSFAVFLAPLAANLLFLHVCSVLTVKKHPSVALRRPDLRGPNRRLPPV